MPCSIEVIDLKNRLSWGQSLPEESFRIVEGYCNGRAVIRLFPATLIPVRTNNLGNFCKDFFAPTLFNYAAGVQDTVRKFFMILGSLILDLLTFPIRMLFCIPRVVQNETRQEQALCWYLKVQGAPFRSEYVRVKLSWEEQNKICRVEKNVNFINLPVYKDCDYQKRISHFRKI